MAAGQVHATMYIPTLYNPTTLKAFEGNNQLPMRTFILKDSTQYKKCIKNPHVEGLFILCPF